mgnify:CR=1 FL=1
MALAALVDKFGTEKVKTADYDEVMLKNATSPSPDSLKKFSYRYYKAIYKHIKDNKTTVTSHKQLHTTIVTEKIWP